MCVYSVPQLASRCIGASKLAGKDGSDEEMLKAFTSEIPLGRAQATWDIAITAVYLASEAARCVNGDILVSPEAQCHCWVQCLYSRQ